MSLLPQQTNANAGLTYFIKANGQQLNVSSLNANSISTATLEVSSLVGQYISTVQLDSEYINNSTINTLHVDLDGQILTASPTELLLNGVPLATTANLSSLSDWSYDPAISTVQMQGNDLNAAGTVSSFNVRAGNGFFQNLIAFNSLFVSTATSTISTVITNAQLGLFSSINSGNASLSTTLDFAPAPSTVIFQDAQPSTFTIGQQVNNLIINDIVLDAQNGIVMNSALPVRVPNVLSTPSLYVSSINGAEFTSTTINVQFGSFSTLATQSISSIGAEIRQALMSTIVFSPSLNPSLGGVNVNLGLGNLLGNVVGWGAGVFGAAVGTVGLITGITALATGRQGQNITNNVFETVNGTTQLQFSTLGAPFSTIYRLNNSADPQSIPGQEIFVSTISPAGLAVRSISDPLYTPSTPQSTIQSFGQWVPVPPELTTSTFLEFNTSSLTASSIQTYALRGDGPAALSTLSTAVIYGANPNLFAPLITGNPGLKIDAPQLFLSTPQVTHPGLFNGSTVGANDVYSTRDMRTSTFTASSINSLLISTNTVIGTAPGGTQYLNFNSDNVAISTAQLYLGNANVNVTTLSPNTLNAQFVNVSQLISSPYIWNWGSISTTALSTGTALAGSLALPGLSTVTLQTTAAAGAQAQPAGRLTIVGNDVDIGQQDLWCQQIRLGAGNPINAQTEIIFYDANANQRGLQTALQDRTIRVVSTINANQGGYILDTGINPPFFSTINAGTSTALFAFFPSSVNSTIGASTLSVIPNPIFVAATASLSSQKVLAANTPLALDLGSASVNVGGFTLSASTLTVPVAGTYQLSPSIQFNTTSGGANQVDFWVTKNGADIPNSASRCSVANNAEQIGTVIIYDTAAANDKYGIKIASGDANMSAGFFQSTVATPYTRPAIPSIILNAQRIA